ncbi:hypothetical protein QJS10_CPB13g01104 [Acorus calamus]|uniref:Uncharacterized protein n=1 Tax=Acorus calamus TaxID=4465 RepID=A0AAV9DGW9_ACOCL|nr:hypothetical protein QJS10_CPB13g01104 [Acorus calamus]
MVEKSLDEDWGVTQADAALDWKRSHVLDAGGIGESEVITTLIKWHPLTYPMQRILCDDAGGE